MGRLPSAALWPVARRLRNEVAGLVFGLPVTHVYNPWTMRGAPTAPTSIATAVWGRRSCFSA